MKVDLFFLPTLQHMASVVIASCLYNSRVINKLVRKEFMRSIHYRSEWDSIEAKAMDELSSNLPCSLQIKVAKLIWRIHEQVVKWRTDHIFIVQYVPASWFYENVRHLYWKSDGTIDNTLTAKKLIMDEQNKVGLRFVMACNYFIEEDIVALWGGVKADWDDEIVETNQTVRFWRKWLRNWTTEPWSEKVDSYYSVPHVKLTDIKLRIISFFPFLTLENKLKYIQFIIGGRAYHDDFRLCLSQLSESERNKILQSEPNFALRCFFDWPLQPLFLNVAKEMMRYMTVDNFKDFIWQLINRYACEEFEDLELFESFWNLSPDVFKDATKNDELYIVHTEIFLLKHCRSSSFKEMLGKLLELKYQWLYSRRSL